MLYEANVEYQEALKRYNAIAEKLPDANEDEAECYWQLVRKFRGQFFNREMSDKALTWIRG